MIGTLEIIGVFAQPAGMAFSPAGSPTVGGEVTISLALRIAVVGKEKYPAVGTAYSLALLHDMVPPCHDSINHLR